MPIPKPNIPQDPIIVKNDWVNYRPGVEEISFILDFASEHCFEGWDAETDEEMYMPELDSLIKTNHNYTDYKNNQKVLFPYQEKFYVGYLAKKGPVFSECIDEEFGFMFRVLTIKLIDAKTFFKQKSFRFYERNFYAADKDFHHEYSKPYIRRGRIINFYTENGKKVFIVLAQGGYISKCTQKDLIERKAYCCLNPNYRY